MKCGRVCVFGANKLTLTWKLKKKRKAILTSKDTERDRIYSM